MDFTTLIILALLFIILPIVLIVVIFLFRAGRKKGAGVQEQEPEQDIHQPSDLEEIARLWRDSLKGELVVEIGEHNFRNSDELNLDQYRRLADVYDDLGGWFATSAKASSPRAVTPIPAVHVEVSPEPSKQVDTPSEPSEYDVPTEPIKQVDAPSEPSEQVEVPPKTSEQVKAPSPAPEQTPKVSAAPVVEEPPHTTPPAVQTSDEFVTPSMNPIDVFSRALRPKAESKVPDLNVVAQIDTILQNNLEATPLENRGIRLVEKPDQTMVVMVGLDEYESVDEVPDDQIKNVIRKAVSEWEDQMLGT